MFSHIVQEEVQKTINSLPEIESAIKQLPEVEARELFDWLQACLDNAWDRKIEVDPKSGRLEKFIQRANADIAANRVKPLKGVLNSF